MGRAVSLRQTVPNVRQSDSGGRTGREVAPLAIAIVGNLDADAQRVGARLVFTNVPVGEVLATLTRWYGYEFRYADSSMAYQGAGSGVPDTPPSFHNASVAPSRRTTRVARWRAASSSGPSSGSRR